MTEKAREEVDKMPHDPNAWKRGMRVCQPGLYEDENGEFHIDLSEMLKTAGVPDDSPERPELVEIVRSLAHKWGARIHAKEKHETDS
jgi:hypothetical protein